jgi:hypothetical protein
MTKEFKTTTLTQVHHADKIKRRHALPADKSNKIKKKMP